MQSYRHRLKRIPDASVYLHQPVFIDRPSPLTTRYGWTGARSHVLALTHSHNGYGVPVTRYQGRRVTIPRIIWLRNYPERRSDPPDGKRMRRDPFCPYPRCIVHWYMPWGDYGDRLTREYKAWCRPLARHLRRRLYAKRPAPAWLDDPAYVKWTDADIIFYGSED